MRHNVGKNSPIILFEFSYMQIEHTVVLVTVARHLKRDIIFPRQDEPSILLFKLPLRVLERARSLHISRKFQKQK